MGYKVNNTAKTEGIPEHIVKPFIEYLNIEFFIETGSADGDSVRWAAQYINECHTIEMVKGRAQKNGGSPYPNIRWYLGNSIDILPELIQRLKDYKQEFNLVPHHYCLFWLDAHYSGDTPNPYPDIKECHLLEELDIISRYDQDAIIVIDDLRLFCGNPPYPANPKEWPSVQQIFKLFEEKYRWFIVTIIDDYIIAFPDRVKWIFDKVWADGYNNRYPNESEKLRQEVKSVYSALKKYIE